MVAPDQRGHGDSDKPISGYGLSEYVNDIKELMNHLELRHAVFAGSSMGGVIAQGFAIRYPQRCKALILVGTLARAIWLGKKESYIEETLAETIPAQVRNWFGTYSNPAHIRYAIRQARKTSPNFHESVVRDFGNFDLRKSLHSIEAPT